MRYIRIHTEHGGDIGEGHYERMSRLGTELIKNALVEFFVRDGSDIALGEKPDVFVYDYMNTDSEGIRINRQRYPGAKHAVFVGNGWTITNEVHSLADAIFYQDPREFERKGHAQVYSGLRYLMIDPRAHLNKTESDKVFVYMGGGSDQKYAESLCRQMAEAGLNVFQAIKGGSGLVNRFLSWNQGWTFDIRKTLSQCALYVGTQGMTTWEALAQRVPCYLMARGPEHSDVANWVESRGWGVNFGLIGSAPAKYMALTAANRLARGWTPYELAQRADLSELDGKGIERVAEIILSL